MTFSTGRVKLNIYYVPNKIKIYLALKEKRRKLLLSVEIPLLQEKPGLLKGRRFNRVYKGHFNVFETLLLNNACCSSVKIKQPSTLLLKIAEMSRWKKRLSQQG